MVDQLLNGLINIPLFTLQPIVDCHIEYTVCLQYTCSVPSRPSSPPAHEGTLRPLTNW